MTVISSLIAQGCVAKTVQDEVDPSIPTYWSQHTWDFDENSAPVILTLYKYVQNERTILTGFMPLGQIDALAGVPSFHSGITNEEAALIALNSEHDPNPPYQRPPDVLRFDGIQSFARNPNSILLNPVTLHLPPDRLASGSGVKIINEDEVQVVLEIDLKLILKQLPDGTYTDVNTFSGEDFRPFHATDGAHRKLSCQLDLRASMLNVPIILAPLRTTIAEAAEIFTNSNVTQEPLKPLHMLLQRYICAIPHRDAKKDFGLPENAENQKTATRRQANRSAYELVSLLATEINALYGRVQTMELPNRKMGRNCSVTSKKFVDYARKWFLEDGMFAGIDANDAFKVFRSYLTAWQLMADTDADGEYYEDSKERWHVNTSREYDAIPYLTSPLAFEVILMLFPLLHKGAIFRTEEGATPTRKTFTELLTPLQPIDWGRMDLLKEAYGLDRDTPDNLYAWCSWAISAFMQTGATYPPEQVWNPETRDPMDCKPGRGFFSAPSRTMIEAAIELPETDETGLMWGQEITLWSSPMPNVHRKPMLAIHLLDGNGYVIFSSTNTQSKRGAELGFAVHRATILSAIAGAATLRAQVNVTNVNGEAQIERIWPISEFTNRLLGDIEMVGKQIEFPPEPSITSEITEENDTEELTSRFAVVSIDESFMVPPPKANTTIQSTDKMSRVPRFATIVRCPRCSTGIECNNSNCIGRTVDGYARRSIV